MLCLMEIAKNAVVAIEGWFDPSPSNPALLGTQCTECSTFYFPREELFCKNPRCSSTSFDQVRLSSRGTIWSFTDAQYQPPPPYVSGDPFEPFALVAVELEREKMVVMGQAAHGYQVDDLSVGMAVELVVETLYEDEHNSYLIWRWKPDGASKTSKQAP